ncbi:MAG TPA: thiamine-phosphate kinase [Candidatus Sulfotelmatobacter sp.]|nr:thiamine-phosphate kinase [Candidatus Sulfotelmatobacter sp.]
MPLAERELIEQIRRTVGTSRQTRVRAGRAAIRVGIGDDCAVLRPRAGHDLLVTTDFTLEGIHFRREWHSPESVGHRCVARGLSDIAAMGGEPVAVFLSLALPRELPPSWVQQFLRGLTRLAEKHGASLAGGDTAESPNAVLADIITLGSVPKGKAVLRSGARAGDRIYTSGQLGGSAAAVTEMQRHPKRKLNPASYPRHFFPEPRIEIGRVLREKELVSAMIDTSDGLSTDLAHICEESGVGAEIIEGTIPRAQVGKPARDVGIDLALHGGEDYELLFTVPGGKRVPPQIAGVPLTCVGEMKRGRKILLKSGSGPAHELTARGWEHFRR